MGDELDDVQRISYRKDFVVVTLAFLLDEPYAPVEDIEREDDYYLKETFATLISGLTPSRSPPHSGRRRLRCPRQ